MQATNEKRWYLVQCKPKQDFRALEHLQHQGYECLLPIHQIERLRKGRWTHQQEPLFPGYIFIELDTFQDNWMPIRSTRGVNQIVRFGANPLPVPISIITRLRDRSELIEHELQPGDRVIIDQAGSQGLEAVFLTKDGTERVILLMNILQREVKVTVSLHGISRVV
ncbi:transcription/translation regulatory transformer protein RfaH [Pseudomonas sp. AU12215]|uniref:transcription/translation regulatory transformer protein RfaH n=1 Tax=Pseudomonas sp. AU12215 TaxID=1860123 RepID=UPI0009F62D48|nr:transcription/translation regulatory transformer protein RfaH [Pseudomonas sp. AU12215]